MDRDPLGLEDEQEHHITIMDWLVAQKATLRPATETEDAAILVDGRDVTLEFFKELAEEVDGIDSNAVYSSDFNHHCGGTVVRWTGSAWEFAAVDARF